VFAARWPQKMALQWLVREGLVCRHRRAASLWPATVNITRAYGAAQARVQRFQTSNIPVFLLTSQVGGLGLTLTAADRVVIVVRASGALGRVLARQPITAAPLSAARRRMHAGLFAARGRHAGRRAGRRRPRRAQDPAWNPAVDAQSVDRAYRIGQARDVVVYRWRPGPHEASVRAGGRKAGQCCAPAGAGRAAQTRARQAAHCPHATHVSALPCDGLVRG